VATLPGHEARVNAVAWIANTTAGMSESHGAVGGKSNNFFAVLRSN